MSKHDYRVTLRQIEEYAGRAQEVYLLLRWPLQSYCEPNW